LFDRYGLPPETDKPPQDTRIFPGLSDTLQAPVRALPQEAGFLLNFLLRRPAVTAQPPVERPIQAAVRFRGITYTGTHHGEAIERAEAEHGPRVYESAKDGFLTDRGRFVGREEAGRMLDDLNGTQDYRGAWFGKDKPLYMEDYDP